MELTVTVLLYIIAIGLFLWAAFAQARTPRVNLTALGLAFFALAHLL